MRKALLVALCAATVAIVPVALGGSQATPGVTAKIVKIGGTFPLTGSASSYAPIPRGMQAYFSYVNAQKVKGKRGVNGRQVLFLVEDDAYNPQQTLQKTQKLVEQDNVFLLLGGLGTEPQLAVRDYLNSKKVPQLYVSTGATTWGFDQKKHHYTLGWQPDYQSEAALYGKYIKANLGGSKLAILYQNDDYGKDYIAGLESGLGGKSQIAATRGFQVTDPAVTSQLVDLRRTGADTLMIFATPAKTIQAYATLARLGWKPEHIFLNSVSATDTFMTTAVRLAGAATVNGSISVQYLKDPASPEWNNDAGMKLYKTIGARYLPDGTNLNDGLYLYGMAKAYDFVKLLESLGPNINSITRDAIMNKALKFTVKGNPFALPGVVTTTSSSDTYPISQQRLIQFKDGTWTAIGKLQNGRGK
jgi:ABC-type branched-subunit amino acid transport system substrate-binding protein